MLYREKFVETCGISAGARQAGPRINFDAGEIDSEPLAICLDRDNAGRSENRRLPDSPALALRAMVSLLICIRAFSLGTRRNRTRDTIIPVSIVEDFIPAFRPFPAVQNKIRSIGCDTRSTPESVRDYRSSLKVRIIASK